MNKVYYTTLLHRFIRHYTCLSSDDVLKNAFLLSSELQGETNKDKSFS